MKLYVSGPMRGIPAFNFPAFFDTADRLRAMGHEPLCPAERDLENGFDPTDLSGFENLSSIGLDLREAMLEDCRMICEDAEGVCVLENWRVSKGARAEVGLAHALGLPIVQLKPLSTNVPVKVFRLEEVPL